MTIAPYPNENDLHALGGVHDLLAALGVAPGPGGYDLTTLAAAIYAHGWAYDIDLGGGGYQAGIRPQTAQTQQPSVAGVGWTPEAALAFALAQALTRRGTVGSRLPAVASDHREARRPE